MHPQQGILEFKGRHEFLSNFYPSNVYILIGTKWVKCPTVEHAFQASKTWSQDKRRRIIEAGSPVEAKKLGRNLIALSYWEEVKKIVMLELLRQKFSKVAMAHKLIATGDVPLVEGNYWHDNYWGVCRCGRPAVEGLHAACDGGENWLGKLLMRVRKDIR